jgi:hypothetical protein
LKVKIIECQPQPGDSLIRCRSKTIDVNDGLGKGLVGLLRRIATDATRNGPTFDFRVTDIQQAGVNLFQ